MEVKAVIRKKARQRLLSGFFGEDATPP